MPRRLEAQTTVGVHIELLWRTFAKEFSVSWPKVIPEIVTNVEILEGDGLLGTLMFLQFKPGGPTVPFQKTKIVEFDDMKHQLGLEVLEGGHLSNGFTKYATYFKLTGQGDTQTLVDIAVECDPVSEVEDLHSKTTKFPLLFFQCLEAYLQKAET